MRNVKFITREPSALFASLGMAVFNGLIMVALYANTFYPTPVIQ